ncbi:hypothetical protein [Dawidia soli]|uniref:Uncharacterized protein n=1 Tax=Dawidia soli TaxID=2782352 RepID=A0AAP2GIM7_9BACT|nr:hypothetical protein [Dawidia soli]MBT1688476.1 hypothetical protein [Dawidia soli]
MKRSTILLGLLIALAISCKDDDTAVKKETGYSFRDQELQGMIGGMVWTHRSGFATTEIVNGEKVIGIDLVQNISGEEVEDMQVPEGNYVFFDVPDAVGVYELSINWDANLASGNDESQTITLYNEATGVSHIATKGAIEILTITDTEVTGRIDARSESGTYINGNFTVALL